MEVRSRSKEEVVVSTYDAGSTFGPVFDKHKVCWVQAEGLNALLLMATLLFSTDHKASPWKCGYHNGRALMNALEMLETLPYVERINP